MLDIPAVLYQISTVGVKGLIHKSDEISELGRAIQEGTLSTPYIGQSVQKLLRKGPIEELPTVRKAEVLKMYVAGNSLRKICRRLHKSVKIVALQKSSAMKKLGLRSDIELGRYCCAMGPSVAPHDILGNGRRLKRSLAAEAFILVKITGWPYHQKKA